MPHTVTLYYMCLGSLSLTLTQTINTSIHMVVPLNYMCAGSLTVGQGYFKKSLLKLHFNIHTHTTWLYTISVLNFLTDTAVNRRPDRAPHVPTKRRRRCPLVVTSECLGGKKALKTSGKERHQRSQQSGTFALCSGGSLAHLF